MVPLILRQEFSGPGLRHSREGGMNAGHPRVGAAPPAECEERRGEPDQSSGDVGPHDVAEARGLVNAERVEKNDQNTVTAMDRTIQSVTRYNASYSRSSSPFRG